MNTLPAEIVRHIFSFKTDFRECLCACTVCGTVCLCMASSRMLLVRAFYMLGDKVTCINCRATHAEDTTSSWGKKGRADGLALSTTCR